MSAQSNQLDVSTKSTQELKAIAYDLQAVLNHYSSILQQVNQEITVRVQREKAQAAAASTEAPDPAPVLSPKKGSKK